MKVYDYLMGRRAKAHLHMTLIDPDRQSPSDAAMVAREAARAGTDAFMVGGSTGVTASEVDATVQAIKATGDVPVILFPSSASGLSSHADAVYFMTLLNSRDPRLIVGEQARAAKTIRSWGLETISMAYLIVEPGMRAGEIGRAEPIPRDVPEAAVEYALVAEMFGLQLVYLEAGSGAPEPVPPEMVRQVRAAVKIPVIVGGGIRTATAAVELARAGADIIVTGTVVERERDALREIVQAVKAA